ncbi:MAG: hypothetical protein FRX49_11239 [Trebouxia sp. A1-2]|nr:MAG: hypothetical protein FRX49_11239 [Trebouxia sp. A1-2]
MASSASVFSAAAAASSSARPGADGSADLVDVGNSADVGDWAGPFGDLGLSAWSCPTKAAAKFAEDQRYSTDGCLQLLAPLFDEKEGALIPDQRSQPTLQMGNCFLVLNN